jgi:hypothetical protein
MRIGLICFAVSWRKLDYSTVSSETGNLPGAHNASKSTSSCVRSPPWISCMRFKTRDMCGTEVYSLKVDDISLTVWYPDN